MATATTNNGDKTMTKEDYIKANKEYGEIADVYKKVRIQYHAREIGDDEFLKVRKARDAALTKVNEIEALVDWDAENQEITEETPDTQIALSF
jgi:DNA-binding PadR family transcriptional regulator